MKNKIERLLFGLVSTLLCAALLCPSSAYAQEESGGLIEPEALQELTDQLIEEHSLNAENISIGYSYLSTGESWYYNEDRWYYAASVYKVPLMMLMAEKVYNGELTQDTVINGITLAQEESLILTYSNTDYARDLRFNYFGGDEIWGEMAMKFSDLAEDEYDPNYITYRYYNVRYINDVLYTLYSQRERFPNVIDCMLLAEPGGYLATRLQGQYEVAQKYGAYIENDGTDNNHAVGIIYTPNPIIVSVMTRNTGGYEGVIGDAAEKLVSYTLTLDDRLEAYQQAKDEEESRAEAEAEANRQKAEKEKEAKAEAEAAKAEAERLAALEEARNAKLKKWTMIGGAALLAAVLVAVLLVKALGRKKSVVGASARRPSKSVPVKKAKRDSRESKRGDHYTPRH